MDTFIDFLVNNYLWLLIVSLILVFALIGYLVDATTPKKVNKIKKIAPSSSPTKEEVHPSIALYTSDQFDEPLMSDKNV